jgi:DNA-binding CsgD family transcriptional regulator
MPDACRQEADFPAFDYSSYSGLAEYITRPADIFHRTAALASNTVAEWLMSSPAPDGTDPVSAAYAMGSLREGITTKILYSDAIRDNPDASALALKLSASGALIRTTATPLPGIVVSDRRSAVILADPASGTPVSTWTGHPAIAVALAALFEQVWSAAIPLAADEAPAAAGASELRRIERQLLTLLAEGATDEVVARQLGVSLRTTRRHIAVLMTRLNAASRFQAGAQAAKKRWLLLCVSGMESAATPGAGWRSPRGWQWQ